MKYTDPITGIKYKNIAAMYKANNITRYFSSPRRNKGMTPEEIVLEYHEMGTKFTDPITGIKYRYKAELYKTYNISRNFYVSREKQGMTPEEIVLEYHEMGTKFTDPITGIKYRYKIKMYNDHDISRHFYTSREKQGMTPEEIVLEFEQGKYNYIDPITGIGYVSSNKMYKAHNIPQSYYLLKQKQGMTPEEIVLAYDYKYKYKFTDPISGAKYICKSKMYDSHGISDAFYLPKEKQGMTPEEIVLEYVNKYRFEDPVTGDILTPSEMCSKYDIETAIFHRNIKRYSIISSVGISFIIKSVAVSINRTKYNLTVHKRIKKGKDVFECYIDNGDGTSTFKIMTYDMIDQYCLEQYKKLHNIA